jgi:hypothetical protein
MRQGLITYHLSLKWNNAMQCMVKTSWKEMAGIGSSLFYQYHKEELEETATN